MAGVPGSEGCPSGRGDTGDLHVANLYRSADTLPGRGDARCRQGGRLVERLHPITKVLCEQLSECLTVCGLTLREAAMSGT